MSGMPEKLSMPTLSVSSDMPAVKMNGDSPAARPSSDDGRSLQNEIDIFGDTSPGVRRARILARSLTTVQRSIIFVCLFFLAYVYGLDGTLRYVYQVSIIRYLKVIWLCISLRKK
jgi:hypothetical protein